MEEMIKTIIEQGVLIIIAVIFFTYNKEDRENGKTERQENKILTKEVIELVKDNKIVIEESIHTKEEMIKSLEYSKGSHDRIENELNTIKTDVKEIKNIVNSKTDAQEIIPLLENLEIKVDELGKSGKNL